MSPRRNGRRSMLLAACAVGVLGGSGCGSLIPTRIPEASESGERGGDAVLLVGRIELIPPLAPGEQKIRAGSFGLDPFGVKETLQGRALLYLAPTAPKAREGSGHYINPKLGEWFAYWIPRSHRHVTEAHVVVELASVVTGRRHSVVRMQVNADVREAQATVRRFAGKELPLRTVVAPRGV